MTDDDKKLVERLREQAENPARSLKFSDGGTISISSWPPRNLLLDEAAAAIERLATPSPEIERIVGEIEEVCKRTSNNPDLHDNARLGLTFRAVWWPALRAALKARSET